MAHLSSKTLHKEAKNKKGLRIMKDKKEFVTTIFVQNEAAVIATGTTEDISVSNAIKAFESKGFEAPTVEKIETVQIPQRYTAAEMA